jgi:gliding motility-associated-like protein
VHQYAATGTYTVTLTAEAGTMCESSVSKTIFVPAPVRADFSITPEVCGPTLTFVPHIGGRYVNVHWDFGDGATGNQTAAFEKSYSREGKYTVRLTVRDVHGCEYSKDTTFLFDPLGDKYLRIPNVFTPNEDGLNDCFDIKAVSADCIEHIEIYDRWGIRVFRSTEFDQCWDGTFSGRPVPEGAYVYVVRTGEFWRVGTVTVIR